DVPGHSPHTFYKTPTGVKTRRPRKCDLPGPWLWLRGLDLNQRPLGYEPNELPDCSTPRCRNKPYGSLRRLSSRGAEPPAESGRAATGRIIASQVQRALMPRVTLGSACRSDDPMASTHEALGQSPRLTGAP